jgi:PAS domain S-box-containing protein
MSNPRSQSEGKDASEKPSLPEDQLRKIIDTIPTLAWSARPDGSAEFFNRRWLDFTGLTAQEALDWGWKDAIHPDDLSRMLEIFHEALNQGRSFEVEGRLRHHDGGFRWFLFRASPLCDESGLVVKWYGTNTDIEDQKFAEEALRKSEERWLAVFENSAIGVALTDFSGRLLFTNSAYQKMLGYTEEEIRKLTFLELTHEDYRETNLELVTELLEGKRKQFQIEKKYRRKDGRLIWVSNNVSLVPGTERVPRFIMALSEDITERKCALEKLQGNQDLLDLAQKAARAMAFDWYIQEPINTWSPEQESLYGLAPGTFDGRYESWRKLVHPNDWPLIVKTLRQAQETGDILVEFRVVWPDGSTHWLAANGQMFFDDKGHPERMVGFTADVTRRKLAEEELRRSEAFLAEAQHLSSTGSFSWRVETDEITWSEQVYRIFEFDQGFPLTLELVTSRVHPDDLSMLHEMFDRARGDGSDFEYEHRLLMPDDSVRHVHLVAHGTRDQDGKLEYIGAIQDVTQQKVSQEALDKARSELGRVARAMSLGAFTASIAHEVNQPLSGIITNASTCLRMLAADPPNVDGARETAQRTIRDGHRASDVITRLRALFGKKDITFEAVDLNEAAREVIALSLSDLQRNRVVLRSQLAEDLPRVAGDRVQLQQVILNLVRNASDAMSTVDDRPRHLVIKTEPDEGDQVRLSVQDAGVGFDPQATKRLFEAFYTTKNDGMGIGLSVSRSIIESHHGRLWATPNDGPGATFSFSIPRETTNQY